MTTSASNKEEKESGRQWLRKCSLLVGKGSDGLELGDQRIVFKTTKGDVETPNSAEINVYNLSEATSSKIRKEFTRVVLQAGYQDNCAVIFDGTIRQVRRFRENGTDVCTAILAADGDAAYNYAVVNTTLAAGSTSAEHVGACQKAFSGKGADTGYIPDMAGPALPRGKVMYGMARKYMRDTAKQTGTSWSIQDGKVVVVPETAYVPGSVPVLSHDSGLVGMPEQTEKGIKLRMLLNPSIRVGGLVNLDNSRIAEYGFQARSEGKDANEIDRAEQRRISGDGYYYVMEVEHRGNTRDDEWYTEVLCLATDATLFPGDLGRAGAEGDAAKPAAVVK